jgi:sulfite exporter TauE/SafE
LLLSALPPFLFLKLAVVVDSNITLLGMAAVTIAFIHTICGPDHYVPFVAMARAGRWTTRKTIWITLLAGIGHVSSSVLLGTIGIALGTVVSRLESIEASRGEAAGWLLTVFGLGYMLWGIYYCLNQTKPIPHVHIHPGLAGPHDHDHDSTGMHPGRHDFVDSGLPEDSTTGKDARAPHPVRLTPWILFTIFIFGPCEPLIPLVMYPAAESSWGGVALVTALFSLTTVATMLGVVLALLRGAEAVRFPAFQRYSHAVAGMLMMICGVAINLGL